MKLTLLDGTPCYFLDFVDGGVRVTYETAEKITAIGYFAFDEILIWCDE